MLLKGPSLVFVKLRRSCCCCCGSLSLVVLYTSVSQLGYSAICVKGKLMLKCICKEKFFKR